MTLGQGYGKVIQHISPVLYFLCPRYVRFRTNGFDAAPEDADAETMRKIKITPDRGDLMNIACALFQAGSLLLTGVGFWVSNHSFG